MLKLQTAFLIEADTFEEVQEKVDQYLALGDWVVWDSPGECRDQGFYAIIFRGNKQLIEWSRDKPAVAGEYWYRCEDFTGKVLAHVYQFEDDGKRGLYVNSEMGGGWVQEVKSGEWSGPLPQPTEN